MAKKIEWENPNKMRFESKHLIFNEQADYISTGNVGSGVQRSLYIRPFNQLRDKSVEIEPSNQLIYKPGEPGYFQERDLSSAWFEDVPEGVKNWIRKLSYAKDHSVILYHFFYTVRGGQKNVPIDDHYFSLVQVPDKKMPVGDVVTTSDFKLLNKWVNKGDNLESVIKEAIKYITD